MSRLLPLLVLFLSGCFLMPTEAPRLFRDDVDFLQRHTEVVTLGVDARGPRVAVLPLWQGRVITSTAGGTDDLSFGWINYSYFEKGELQPHINVVGGEDRLWLGPEGGQYSVFFEDGAPFDLEHWQTPACMDSVAYDVTSQDAHQVSFRYDTQLMNYSGTRFAIQLDRTVALLSEAQFREASGVDLPVGVDFVAYESRNRLTNAGDEPFLKENGLLSIWILGMFKHSPTTTAVLPFQGDAEAPGAKVVNDAYFGKVPPERLAVKDGVVYFRCDGARRSKIGLGASRAREVLGSYDAQRAVLTVIQYTRPPDANEYVNSMWELQAEPYAGDVVNSYNDGPPGPGVPPLGPFYELETSSPAVELGPGESLEHVHRTMHFVGPREGLDALSRYFLGVALETIEGAFLATP